MPENLPEFIHVGPHGSFTPSGQFSSTPASIDALFAALRQSQRAQVVLYFHGGLVSEESAVTNAAKLAPKFEQLGAQPAFFIWETGPWETIRQNLTGFLSTKLIRDLLFFVIGQVARRWGVDIPGKGPGETPGFDEIEAELAKDQPFAAWQAPQDGKGGPAGLTEQDLPTAQAEMELELALLMQARSAELEAGLSAASSDPLTSPELRSAGEDLQAKGLELAWLAQLAARAAIGVLRRLIQQQDHGLYPTAVEEVLRASSADSLGKFFWDSMKTKAAEMWLENPQPLPTDSRQAFPASYFLDRLVEYASATPGFHADLVGHSAGSIVICELLKAAAQRHPGFRFGRIALMAPAARLDLFVREVISHPERFEDLRVYNLAEAVEMKDAIAGKLYPLSLLYLVSGLLEDPAATPLCGLARSLTGAGPNRQGDPLAAHHYLYQPGTDRLVFSVTPADAPPGLRANAEHHGDFDNLQMPSGAPGETVQSLQVYLRR